MRLQAAIAREVHGTGHVHFTEKHPELAQAAQVSPAGVAWGSGRAGGRAGRHRKSTRALGQAAQVRKAWVGGQPSRLTNRQARWVHMGAWDVRDRRAALASLSRAKEHRQQGAGGQGAEGAARCPQAGWQHEARNSHALHLKTLPTSFQLQQRPGACNRKIPKTPWLALLQEYAEEVREKDRERQQRS